jgi:hypothetical protein
MVAAAPIAVVIASTLVATVVPPPQSATRDSAWITTPAGSITATATAAPQADSIPTISVPPTREIGAPLTAERPESTLPALLDSLSALGRPARVVLLPGRHDLAPIAYSDPSCGNCDDPDSVVSATRGLRASGSGIEIVGVSAESVFIHTNAGYGILFDECRDCGLRGVTVTGGARDPDGRATDAAVVARESRVAIESCILRDNIGDMKTVHEVTVGIMGITGREGADLTVRDCQIVRNSWDGIALYHGARAVIENNVIDGVDKARGETIGGGRGVGIGLTWDSRATIEGNFVTRYWKGIGIFVDAQADVRRNVVEDVLTWGIAYWDAGRGAPVADIRENAIYGTGACGVSITREDQPEGEKDSSVAGRDSSAETVPGAFVGNALVMTGQNSKYDAPDYFCHQQAIAEEAVPEGFVIRDNLLYANREAGGTAGRHDLDADAFRSAVQRLVFVLSQHPALLGSNFLRDFRAQ